MRSNKTPFVDLFCGAGGLSAGFEMAGFKSVFANDYDGYACETYKVNHPECVVHEGDVQEVTAEEIFARTGLQDIPLVIGGPNCQGVSLRGKRDPNDPKNKAFYNFVRLVKELNPEWFVMENVPGLMHKHNRDLATSIFEEFSNIGYECGAEVLLAADYGVPQLRYRLFLIGTRTGRPIQFPDQTHAMPTIDGELPAHLSPWRTVRDAISDLRGLRNGQSVTRSSYATTIAAKSELGCCAELLEYYRGEQAFVENHACHKSTDGNIALIKHIPQGGNWRNIPETLRPPRFKNVALKDHTTTYGRLNWNMPSRTITTYFNNISSGAFTHPRQHRGISVREGARLQGFKDSFVFKGTLARQYRQVGNAVPPLMAFHIANSIAASMDSPDQPTISTLHTPAIEYDLHGCSLRINRPIQGMRFNLDKYLVIGGRHGVSNGAGANRSP